MNPTRSAGLERLAEFQAHVTDYAKLRNYDLVGHPHVSRLSPYLRYRLLDEEEVLFAASSKERSEMFVREVFWRGYFKGWLQMRPNVWREYRKERDEALLALSADAGLASRVQAATSGQSGIECIDFWSRELQSTGYLHNHARMWFASIWIYTLRLPWTLGADFFLRHLLDGDAASNTLSWRWVGGLHTQGKTYLARRENIQKFTEGRFAPEGLATEAPPLRSAPPPPADVSLLPEAPFVHAEGATSLPSQFALLVTPADLNPAHIVEHKPAARFVAGMSSGASPRVHEFVQAACADAEARLGARFLPSTNIEELAETLSQYPAVVTSFAPAGETADALARLGEALRHRGSTLVYAVRDYDRLVWPHARAGFFKLGKKIPQLMGQLFP